MKTDTRQKVYEIIKKNYPIWVTKIALLLGLSNEIIHRHVKKLINENLVYKTWAAPKVYYFPLENINKNEIAVSQNDSDFLDNNFLDFTPDGQMISWPEGFSYWCKKRWLDISKEISLYKDTIIKYNSYKNKDGYIDGKQKILNTFDQVYLDEIYYLDFYSIEKYGKTLLWNLMFYWKQSGDKEIIWKILSYVKTPIYTMIFKKNIDWFWFIPPSIDRKIQIMTELKKWLQLSWKELKLIKIFKQKVVSQKSLSKSSDRIINARETIFIENPDFSVDTILLIDDAVWSGSTLNETAKKIKEKNIAKKVIWLAIVWSFKGFEVINEV